MLQDCLQYTVILVVFTTLNSWSWEKQIHYVIGGCSKLDQFSYYNLPAHQPVELLHTVYSNRLRTGWKYKCNCTATATVCCSYSCTDIALGKFFVLQCAVHTVVQTLYWENSFIYSVMFTHFYRHCIGPILSSTVCCSYSCTDIALGEFFHLQSAVHTVVQTLHWENSFIYSVLFIQLYRNCIGRILSSTVCCS